MRYKQATWWEYPTNQHWYTRDYGTGYQYKPQDDQCLHLQCPSCHGTGVNKSTGGYVFITYPVLVLDVHLGKGISNV